MTRFSIVLPVRNGGELLKLCINSILMQEYKEFDLLVLDNNSSDGSTDWLLSLKDTRVKVFTANESLSINDNWKRILEVQKNEFMTLIGHDDLLYPGFLMEMNGLITQYPDASLYHCHFDYIDSDGNILRQSRPMPRVQTVQQLMENFLQCRIDSMGTGYVMRSADYDRLGGIPVNFPNLLFADFALWITLTDISYVATSPEKCFAFRLH